MFLINRSKNTFTDGVEGVWNKEVYVKNHFIWEWFESLSPQQKRNKINAEIIIKLNFTELRKKIFTLWLKSL